MHEDKKTYKSKAGKQTIWASPELTSKIAGLALDIAREKGGDPLKILEALNVQWLSGGRSGRFRRDNERVLNATCLAIRDYCFNGGTRPDKFGMYNKDPLQREIVIVERSGR